MGRTTADFDDQHAAVVATFHAREGTLAERLVLEDFAHAATTIHGHAAPAPVAGELARGSPPKAKPTRQSEGGRPFTRGWRDQCKPFPIR